MITVYLTREFEGKTWLHGKAAIPKMHGYIIILPSGFGRKDREIFFPMQQIERIEL